MLKVDPKNAEGNMKTAVKNAVINGIIVCDTSNIASNVTWPQ